MDRIASASDASRYVLESENQLAETPAEEAALAEAVAEAEDESLQRRWRKRGTREKNQWMQPSVKRPASNSCQHYRYGSESQSFHS